MSLLVLSIKLNRLLIVVIAIAIKPVVIDRPIAMNGFTGDSLQPFATAAAVEMPQTIATLVTSAVAVELAMI